MDSRQYLEIFIEQTKSELQEVKEAVLGLEKEPNNRDLIKWIFVCEHSLKGMAYTMGYKRMHQLHRRVEEIFWEICRHDDMNMIVAPELIEVMFRYINAVEKHLNNIIACKEECEEENESIHKDFDHYYTTIRMDH